MEVWMATGARRLFLACAMLCVATSASPWASADDREPTIQTPMPERWLPSGGMKCKKAGGSSKMKMCEGPRRAPEPFGEAAERAEELGLGTHDTAQRLLRQAPKSEWVNAVRDRKHRTLLWPVEDGSFGRGFGFVRKQKRSIRHDGIDIGAAVGEQVRSINDGIVAYSDNGVSGYGNMIMVVHADASVSFYCHHRSNFVFPGQTVKRGQVIGEVGLTGITRGPHLHFEWHVRGHAKDPMPYMVGRPHKKRGPLASFDDLWM
jgi:murein DD-endopeptidase MepM/ murein hydrolase activator NlpD